MVVRSSQESSGQSTSEKRRMQFCPYCGTKLDEGARFCKNCGEAISSKGGESNSQTNGFYERTSFERKSFYDGVIHKCPNCGEIIDSFVTNCPACGYEIRDTKSATSVREFALKLEKITAQKMPDFEEKKSVMKMVFGKDLKNSDEIEEARKNFEVQKNKEKASLIINYSVPNTKEDILEFMILAASNIDVKQGIDDTVTKAWISKLDQVYQRAEISMYGQPEFEQVGIIYDRKMREIRNKKINRALIFVGIIGFQFFLIGMISNPTATIPITACLIIIVIVVVIFLRNI